MHNQYLLGDVWGFVVEDKDGEHLDSCWGFFGDDEYFKSQYTEAAKYQLSELEKVRDAVEVEAVKKRNLTNGKH